MVLKIQTLVVSSGHAVAGMRSGGTIIMPAHRALLMPDMYAVNVGNYEPHTYSFVECAWLFH